MISTFVSLFLMSSSENTLSTTTLQVAGFNFILLLHRLGQQGELGTLLLKHLADARKKGHVLDLGNASELNTQSPEALSETRMVK